MALSLFQERDGGAWTRTDALDVNSGQIWSCGSVEVGVSKHLLMDKVYLMLLNIYMKIEYGGGSCVWISCQRFWLKL